MLFDTRWWWMWVEDMNHWGILYSRELVWSDDLVEYGNHAVELKKLKKVWFKKDGKARFQKWTYFLKLNFFFNFSSKTCTFLQILNDSRKFDFFAKKKFKKKIEFWILAPSTRAFGLWQVWLLESRFTFFWTSSAHSVVFRKGAEESSSEVFYLKIFQLWTQKQIHPE